MRHRHFWIILSIIVISTFGFRLSQLVHGLPDVQIGDENSDLSIALRILKGQLPPAETRYHRTIISNLELVCIGALYIRQVLTTRDTSFAHFQDLYFSDRGQFVIAVRLLVLIIFAIAQIALADLMRKAIFPLAGLLAALLSGVYYLWNLHILYAMPDSLSASAIVFFLWATIQVLQKGNRLSYGLAGITLAFVMLTKLFNAPVIIAFFIAHGFRTFNEGGYQRFLQRLFRVDRLLLFGSGLLFGNLLLNPLAFIQPQNLAVEWNFMFSYINRESTYGLNFLLLINNTINHFALVIYQYLGLGLGISIVVGILAILRTRKQAWTLLLVATLVIWLSIGIQAFKPSYWIGAIPLVIIIASIGMSSFIVWAGKHSLAVAAIILVGLVIINETRITVNSALIMRREYTFIQAQQYIYQNWPKDTSILMGPNITYSIPVQRNEESIQRARKLGATDLQVWAWWLRQPANARNYEYNIYSSEYQAIIDTYTDVQKLIADEKIQYVIAVDNCEGTDARPWAEADQEFPPLNDEIRKSLRLVKVFSPYVGDAYCPAPIYDRTTILNRNEIEFFQRPGPIIRLYAVN